MPRPSSNDDHSHAHRAAPPVIQFANLKGGAGKTFLTSIIALALAEAGYQVGLRDTDVEQQTLSDRLRQPAFSQHPRVRAAPFGATDFSVILADSPPRLHERDFAHSVASVDLVCIPVMPSWEYIDPTFTTIRLLQERLPNKPACLLLNDMDMDKAYSRDLRVTLTEASAARNVTMPPILDNWLPHRESYRNAINKADGYSRLSDSAHVALVMVAIELMGFLPKPRA